MPISVPASIRLLAKRMVFLCLLILCILIRPYAQTCPPGLQTVQLPAPSDPNLFHFTGMIENLPADYGTDPNKKYPVILYFPGLLAQGNGSPSDLCKIFTDQQYHPAWYISVNKFPAVFTEGGHDYSFIILSVQYDKYDAPYHFGQDIDNLIDYVQAHYQVDPARIYITGMSAGANLVIDYIASSVDRAKRVAGASLSSVCYGKSLMPNGPANIAAAKLPVWFVHCSLETTGFCAVSIPDDWVASINAEPNGVQARYTRLDQAPTPTPTPNLDTLIYCQPYPHSTWPTMYSPAVDNVHPERTMAPNLYHWFLQHDRSGSLPIVLKDFSASLMNGKVRVRWTTSTENNSSSFTIERAGSDQKFTGIANIKASGNSSTDKQYEYIDEKPLPDVSYYRLVQTDLDGREKRSVIRRVMNRNGRTPLLVISPNPFHTDLSAFLNVNRSQIVSVILTDLDGRTLMSTNGRYAEGATEINLPTGKLPAGIYFLKIKGVDFSVTQKVVKQ